MTVRFQADADLNQIIVNGLLRREPTIDFQTAGAAELEGIEDLQVLKLAAHASRVLVSHDRRTMPRHFAEFISTQTSAGVIILSQDIAIPVAISELALIWAASTQEEWINRIAFVPF